jgi:hypothetical protein
MVQNDTQTSTIRAFPPGVPIHMSNPKKLHWIGNPSHQRSNDLKMYWNLRWNRFHVPKIARFGTGTPDFQSKFPIEKGRKQVCLTSKTASAERERFACLLRAVFWFPKPALFLASPGLWQLSCTDQPPVVRRSNDPRACRLARAGVLAKGEQN